MQGATGNGAGATKALNVCRAKLCYHSYILPDYPCFEDHFIPNSQIKEGEAMPSTMPKGVCPQCGSKEVFLGTQITNKRGQYDSNTIPISMLFTAVLDNFVCTRCGYVESYILDSVARQRIAETWQRVGDIQPATERELPDFLKDQPNTEQE
jgi:predicted nucleic-acid-binding Zn-ribbon protein